MMRCTLIGVAIGMGFAGAVSLAVAQQAPGDRDKRPAAEDGAPEGKSQRGRGASQERATERSKAIDRPKAADQPRKDQPRATERSDKDRSKATERPDRDRPRATERPDTDRPRATERPDRDRPRATERPDRDRPRATERPDTDRPRATERPDTDRPRATERPDRDRPRATERPDRDRPRATERPDRDRPKATERPDRDRPRAAQPETGKDRRVQVSEKQRSEVGDRLRQGRVEKTTLDVRANVGSRIPRSVRLRPLPVAIFAFAPVYRGYHYAVLEDETIIIVEPSTHVIVDVIPAGTRRVESPGSLVLSDEQMRFIYSRVPKDRTVDVRVRLALGAEVPRTVALQRFPSDVVKRVPVVGRYRFVVTDADDDVVIVDPDDHAVVLVISD